MISEPQLVQILLTEQIRLTAYIIAIVREDDLAEDVFQEVSMVAFEKRATIVDEAHLRGWLRVTAKNLSFKALREKARRPATIDAQIVDLLDEHWEDFDVPADSERVQALRQCLNRLSPYGQEIIRRRYVDGLTGEALAGSLGRKVKAVYVAMTRVHQALAKCIEQSLGDRQEGRLG